MLNLLFSYAHEDEDLRDQLEVHLTSLKREGIIATWHDRRIVAGAPLDGEISAYLENANIILLLVSPYFIASDYCFNIEMTRAMERHNHNPPPTFRWTGFRTFGTHSVRSWAGYPLKNAMTTSCFPKFAETSCDVSFPEHTSATGRKIMP